MTEGRKAAENKVDLMENDKQLIQQRNYNGSPLAGCIVPREKNVIKGQKTHVEKQISPIQLFLYSLSKEQISFIQFNSIFRFSETT